MISVVIPTLNAERTLAATLAALVEAAVDGVVREVIVADGGSTDLTRNIVDQSGADLVECSPGRGRQLVAGAARAKFPWLLFLHADTVLSPGWEEAAVAFMRSVELSERGKSAAAFRFRLDDKGAAPRILELMVRARGAILRLPYGDQGLLISRCLYDEIGGFSDLPIMEDVEIVRRLGRRRMTVLDSVATTSAERYRTDGYVMRVLRNQMCRALYGAGVPPEKIRRFYNRSKART